MNPQFPIYIPSKGRSDSRVTMRALQSMGVPFYVIVEAHDLEAYRAVIEPPSQVLLLPRSYQENYETYDDLGFTKSKGPGAARNFAWDHSLAAGATWHWVMDDNIRGFYRMRRNTKYKVGDGTILRAMEDFTLRYTNIAMAGPNYEFFVARRESAPPFITNTRIYSCNLIRNDLLFRWQGRYNEDTDLSLRMLKAGYVTVQFNAFLAKKISTQLMAGGNTADFYAKEGTLAKSQMLVDRHPDCARLVKKYQRWHHHVDYHRFTTKLVRRADLQLPEGSNEYGMKLFRVRPAHG
jgi:TET-Associated Glycosyltransferase